MARMKRRQVIERLEVLHRSIGTLIADLRDDEPGREHRAYDLDPEPVEDIEARWGIEASMPDEDGYVPDWVAERLARLTHQPDGGPT